MKKIKVRLTSKVNSYRYGDTSYKPGDEFELPERLFRPDFHIRVTPPAKTAPKGIAEDLSEGKPEETPEEKQPPKAEKKAEPAEPMEAAVLTPPRPEKKGSKSK